MRFAGPGFADGLERREAAKVVDCRENLCELLCASMKIADGIAANSVGQSVCDDQQTSEKA